MKAAYRHPYLLLREKIEEYYNDERNSHGFSPLHLKERHSQIDFSNYQDLDKIPNIENKQVERKIKAFQSKYGNQVEEEKSDDSNPFEMAVPDKEKGTKKKKK